MHDLRIESTSKITGYDIKCGGGVNTSGKVAPWWFKMITLFLTNL